jgi:hypothetical protein
MKAKTRTVIFTVEAVTDQKVKDIKEVIKSSLQEKFGANLKVAQIQADVIQEGK